MRNPRKEWEIKFGPKIVTKICPKSKAKAPNSKIFCAWLSYKIPKGIIKNMETALGIEYNKLNSGTERS